MKTTRFYLLCGVFYFWLTVAGQNSVQVELYPHKTITLNYETFDTLAFRTQAAKSGSLDYVYTEPDGTQACVSSLRIGEPIEVYEIPPLPAVHRIFKEFYPDGKLKRKGIYLHQQFRIGKWLECNESGYCSIIDQDTDRGAFGYNGLLKALEDRGYINFQTGEDNWIFTTWFNEYSRRWGVKLQKEKKYKQLIFNADSGEILEESEYEVKLKNTTIKGNHKPPAKR
jgi:hypothetical protein